MTKARYAAVMGLMLATASALTAIETLLSALLPMHALGMRIGLSNVVVMTAAFTLNLPSALVLVVLKSLFVSLTRGFTAGAMSFGGGICAFLMMTALFRSAKTSYVMISVLCSLAHTAGQLFAASVMLKSVFPLYYAPAFLFAAVLSGVCTGAILNALLKVLSKKPSA
jgi:heptaprenyl diphosphate synthase